MPELMMMLATALAVVDSVLAVLIFSVYLRLYRRVRAPLSQGLMVFSVFLIAQGVASVITYVAMVAIIPVELAPLLVVMMALEALGLGVLLRTALA